VKRSLLEITEFWNTQLNFSLWREDLRDKQYISLILGLLGFLVNILSMILFLVGLIIGFPLVSTLQMIFRKKWPGEVSKLFIVLLGFITGIAGIVWIPKMISAKLVVSVICLISLVTLWIIWGIMCFVKTLEPEEKSLGLIGLLVKFYKGYPASVRIFVDSLSAVTAYLFITRILLQTHESYVLYALSVFVVLQIIRFRGNIWEYLKEKFKRERPAPDPIEEALEGLPEKEQPATVKLQRVIDKETAQKKQWVSIAVVGVIVVGVGVLGFYEFQYGTVVPWVRNVYQSIKSINFGIFAAVAAGVIFIGVAVVIFLRRKRVPQGETRQPPAGSPASAASGGDGPTHPDLKAPSFVTIDLLNKIFIVGLIVGVSLMVSYNVYNAGLWNVISSLAKSYMMYMASLGAVIAGIFIIGLFRGWISKLLELIGRILAWKWTAFIYMISLAILVISSVSYEIFVHSHKFIDLYTYYKDLVYKHWIELACIVALSVGAYIVRYRTRKASLSKVLSEDMETVEVEQLGVRESGGSFILVRFGLFAASVALVGGIGFLGVHYFRPASKEKPGISKKALAANPLHAKVIDLQAQLSQKEAENQTLREENDRLKQKVAALEGRQTVATVKPKRAKPPRRKPPKRQGKVRARPIKKATSVDDLM